MRSSGRTPSTGWSTRGADRLLDLFAEYRVPLLILSAVLVGGSMLMDRKRGRGELEAIMMGLEEELGED